jgi:hypothetical protein
MAGEFPAFVFKLRDHSIAPLDVSSGSERAPIKSWNAEKRALDHL